MKTTILSTIVALILGAGGGYVAASGTSTAGQNSKQSQDSIAMMNTQSTSIKQMGAMMKTSGMSMQDMGMKYKDDALVQQGKDLQAVGEKYLNENTSRATEGGMNQMMTR